MAQVLPTTAQLATMRELNLYGKAWVGNHQAVTLAAALADNTSLTFLGFRECRQVSDAAAVALARMLASNCTIKKLIFESTGVGDAGARALAGALQTSGLARLDLGYCPVGDVGVCALAKALADNPPTLSVLVLDHCVGVTDRGAAALAGALASNTVLRTLGLKGTSVSLSGRAAVEAMLRPGAPERRSPVAAGAEGASVSDVVRPPRGVLVSDGVGRGSSGGRADGLNGFVRRVGSQDSSGGRTDGLNGLARAAEDRHRDEAVGERHRRDVASAGAERGDSLRRRRAANCMRVQMVNVSLSEAQPMTPVAGAAGYPIRTGVGMKRSPPKEGGEYAKQLR